MHPNMGEKERNLQRLIKHFCTFCTRCSGMKTESDENCEFSADTFGVHKFCVKRLLHTKRRKNYSQKLKCVFVDGK